MSGFMAKKSEVKLISWEWMQANHYRINWKQICRESRVPYTKVVNAFRYDNELPYMEMKKLSKILVPVCDNQCGRSQSNAA